MTPDAIRTFLTRIDTLDVDALVGDFAADGALVFGNNPPAVGRTAIRTTFEGLFHLLAGTSHELHDLWPVSDGFVAELTITHQVQGADHPVPVSGVIVFETQGDKIARARFAFDINPVLAEAKAALQQPDGLPDEAPMPPEPEMEHRTSERGGVFEIPGDDEPRGTLTYVRSNETLAIVDHTYVAPWARGARIGERLVESLTEWARSASVRIIPLCPFARSVYARRLDLRDVLAQG